MISIIIPVHNEKQHLSNLLARLGELASDLPFEVIVVGSSATNDGSEQLTLPRNGRFISCAGKGRAVQMNLGVESSMGARLVFLHADVIPPKTFLSDIDNTLKGPFEAGFFSYKFNSTNVFLKINAWFTSKDGIFTGGGDQCLFIKKESFLKLGGFDESQVLMEDFEFFHRMKKQTIRYRIIRNDLLVSARKYEKNSYLRVTSTNLLLVLLYKLGYAPKRLKSMHDKLLRTAYETNR